MKTDFAILSGTMSHHSTTTTVQGSVRKGKGDVHTYHKSDFRIGGQAVVFNDSVNISDGDKITIVGKIKRGVFKARVVRNEETGVIYSGMTTLAYFLGALCIVLGIALSFILVGVPILLGGLWFVFDGYMNRSAIKSLP